MYRSAGNFRPPVCCPVQLVRPCLMSPLTCRPSLSAVSPPHLLLPLSPAASLSPATSLSHWKFPVACCLPPCLLPPRLGSPHRLLSLWAGCPPRLLSLLPCCLSSPAVPPRLLLPPSLLLPPPLLSPHAYCLALLAPPRACCPSSSAAPPPPPPLQLACCPLAAWALNMGLMARPWPCEDAQNPFHLVFQL